MTILFLKFFLFPSAFHPRVQLPDHRAYNWQPNERTHLVPPAPPMLKPFLTANWRYLAMLNFAVDSKILAPHVPAGTQLDFRNDKTHLSVVGFLFYHAKPRRALQ